MEADEVARLNHRDALEEWLAAPTDQQAEAEKALIRFLGVA